jgi:hypothetical protein
MSVMKSYFFLGDVLQGKVGMCMETLHSTVYQRSAGARDPKLRCANASLSANAN